MKFHWISTFVTFVYTYLEHRYSDIWSETINFHTHVSYAPILTEMWSHRETSSFRYNREKLYEKFDPFYHSIFQFCTFCFVFGKGLFPRFARLLYNVRVYSFVKLWRKVWREVYWLIRWGSGVSTYHNNRLGMEFQVVSCNGTPKNCSSPKLLSKLIISTSVSTQCYHTNGQSRI